MRFKKTVYLFLTFLIFTALILGLIILTLKKSQQLEVSFLNVGQGDAILIESGNRQVLIDTGKNGRTILEKLRGKVVLTQHLLWLPFLNGLA